MSKSLQLSIGWGMRARKGCYGSQLWNKLALSENKRMYPKVAAIPKRPYEQSEKLEVTSAIVL